MQPHISTVFGTFGACCLGATMSKFYIASLQLKDAFVRTQRKVNQGGDGIDFSLGSRSDGTVSLESILFDSGKFSREQVSEWLAANRKDGPFSISEQAVDLKGLEFNKIRELVQEAITEQYPPVAPSTYDIPHEGAVRYNVTQIWAEQALAYRGYWSAPEDPCYLLFPYTVAEPDEDGDVGVALGDAISMKLMAVAMDDPTVAIEIEMESGVESTNLQEAGRRNSSADAKAINQILKIAASLLSVGEVEPDTLTAMKPMMGVKTAGNAKEEVAPREGEDPHILEAWNSLDGATFTENFTAIIGEASFFNEKTMVVSGVSVLGPTSKNKRRYSIEVQKESLSVFEGAKAYLNHPAGREMGDSRRVQDLIGEHKNLRVSGDRTFSDLHLIDNQTTREHVVPIIKQKPHLVGNSIVVRGVSERAKDGWEDVTKILEVRSIDVVAEPATTNGLYESENVRSEEDMELKDLTAEELLAKRPDLAKAILDGTKEKQENEQKFASLESQVAEQKKLLQERDAEIAATKAEREASEKKVKIESLLVGAKIPDVAKYETIDGKRQFRSALRVLLDRCSDEASMSGLIVSLEAVYPQVSVGKQVAISTPTISYEQKIEEGAGPITSSHVAKLNALF